MFFENQSESEQELYKNFLKKSLTLQGKFCILVSRNKRRNATLWKITN
jgi:hypothetical protein